MFWLVLPSLTVAPLLAQEGETLSIFDYMIENGYEEAVITTDLELLLTDRASDPVYQARLSEIAEGIETVSGAPVADAVSGTDSGGPTREVISALMVFTP